MAIVWRFVGSRHLHHNRPAAEGPQRGETPDAAYHCRPHAVDPTSEPHPSFQRPTESYAKMTLCARFCQWRRRWQGQEPRAAQSCNRSLEVHAAQLVEVHDLTAVLRFAGYQVETGQSGILRTMFCLSSAWHHVCLFIELSLYQLIN